MNNLQTFVFASINRDAGRLAVHKSYIMYGAGAIALYELLKMGRLTCDGKSVTSASSASAGSEILDEVNKLIIKKGTSYKMRSLISAVPYKLRSLFRQLTEDLEGNGLIRLEQGRFLGLMPYNRYVVTNEGKHEKMLFELKYILITGNRRAEPDMAFLISLLYICRVLKNLFRKEEKKELKEVFRSIGKFNYFETLDASSATVLKAVRDAIAAAEAAAI
jgi:hypothetical protein